MKLENGICSKCHSKGVKKAENEPFYVSAATELDFGLVPTYFGRAFLHRPKFVKFGELNIGTRVTVLAFPGMLQG